ncbi:MAG: DNA mismatch repair protein MutS, partial [Planctomycetaceae bacterium]
AVRRINPRELVQLKKSLKQIAPVKELLAGGILDKFASQLDACEALVEKIDKELRDDAPVLSNQGRMVQSGVDSELDELHAISYEGKDYLIKLQNREIERTGISSLKIAYNKVFGYYLEVNQSQAAKVPADFIRKQTLKNCERFITPALKEYEEKVLAADGQADEREQAIFVELRSTAHRELRALQAIAGALAHLDVLASLAELAAQRKWVRPKLTSDPILQIEDGRHPVLDLKMSQGEFVPNDCMQSPEAGMVLLITGPNMAGKSTYIRQVALMVLLAQVGSFLPAKKATIGIADRIFARVGASDELSRGQSTFMVEMVETARILNTATSQSLVILDEIGRGTSTYDGLSLAWAITEHLHEQIGCRTLFATHYHELTQLADMFPQVANLNVAVREWDDSVVFLHRIIPGGADKSYGIHVARLAGIPTAVNERAKDILAQLEADHRDELDRPTITPPKGKAKKGDMQLTLFGFADHPVIDEIKRLNIDKMSPLDALSYLQRAQTAINAR